MEFFQSPVVDMRHSLYFKDKQTCVKLNLRQKLKLDIL